MARKGQSKDLRQTALSLDTPPAWVVYVLCDPRITDPVQRIRYVGVTHQKPSKRLSTHLTGARRGEKTHRDNWIRQLLSVGLRPIMEVIDPGMVERGWDKTEVAWIKHFREMGCPLTNATDGGDGSPGHIVSPEARAKSSEAQRGRPKSPETRARMSEAGKLRMADPALRAKIGERNRKNRHTPEARKKISEAGRRRVVTPETREKMSKSQKGRVRIISPEMHEKLSESHRGRIASTETRMKMSETQKKIGNLPEERERRREAALEQWRNRRISKEHEGENR